MTDSQPSIAVYEAASLPAALEDQILALFDLTYDRANHAYLLASIEKLGWIAVGEVDGPRARMLAGFAVGDSRMAALPRMPGLIPVAMAGIGCIHPDVRQQGLFTALALAALNANGVLSGADRFVFCGRMAHPITYRTAVRSARGVIPTAGRVLSQWHREMLVAIADLYGVAVDTENGVVIGSGAPIGYPRLTYEASAEEKSLFQPVNRDRGDSLLALGWIPEEPADWLT